MANENSIYEGNRERARINKNQLLARQRRLANRQVRRNAEQSKQFFKEAKQSFQKNSPESQAARQGRAIVRGVSSSLRGGYGRGFKGNVRLPRIQPTEWSDMGLIAGSGFKSYQSRPVFPSSLKDRTLHPQEKAEIDAALQKIRLFGAPPLQVLPNTKKKQGDTNP